ncbi:hypothetical protein PG984_010243 [Apiospora sp. TS-2023a]
MTSITIATSSFFTDNLWITLRMPPTRRAHSLLPPRPGSPACAVGVTWVGEHWRSEVARLQQLRLARQADDRATQASLTLSIQDLGCQGQYPEDTSTRDPSCCRCPSFEKGTSAAATTTSTAATAATTQTDSAANNPRRRLDRNGWARPVARADNGELRAVISILISLAHDPGSLTIRLPGNPRKNHEVYQGSVRVGPQAKAAQTKRNETT